MNKILATITEEPQSLYFDEAFKKCQVMMDAYWQQHPDLFKIIQQKRQESAANDSHQESDSIATKNQDTQREPQPLMGPLRDVALRAKIRESYEKIHQRTLTWNADIVPLTQAHNRKSPYQSVDEEREYRAEVVSAQLKAWRSLLPNLIRRFSKLPDPRRTQSVKHKVSVLLLFGLLAFVFRMSSRREMNRELTSPVMFESLRKFFPEIDSIPHADTLARFLENTDPKAIEAIQIELIRELIENKKFKKLLIQGCLPITVDGTQKLYRDDLLQDARWCERNVAALHKETTRKQQYIYVIEANITLQNGLSIPLMTEYLYRENNQLLEDHGKQDSETTAFERLAARLKSYFPRLKLIFFMDGMYATQAVMGLLHQHHWQYIISLPRRKLIDFAKQLNQAKSLSETIPNQPAYRERLQTFYWQNDITYGYEWELTLHLAACMEQYYDVDKTTGEIIECFSEHAWISSIKVNIDKVHELFNLGARKIGLIEDSINTEKNRGYHYKHAYSYDWHAMQCFHYLMRLAHAINAISQFTKALRRYIKENGISATLKLIKETLFSPWLSTQWYEQQTKITPQLRL